MQTALLAERHGWPTVDALARARRVEPAGLPHSALAAARRDARGRFQAFLEHGLSNPLARGSYTCYRPGQFTTIAGNEGKPVGNLHFAGEHADSFDVWQGFMEGAEGAALSGLQAAGEILQDLTVGALG